ncbi:MAG: uridine kinase [Aquabacterium sp.]|jgi:uridine kinase|uniref:uridine kinase n=1 Tax=Aquabacterium sp. TaxID=1872578 RepID=UPI002A36F644|nr:uridine kinase [Aquabacterium sp.]MDX9845237.1 uridine kinase [Aquabacterium sp.]
MSKLILHPLFLLGVALRLALLVLLQPWAETQWYLPFLSHWFEAPSIDPWSRFLVDGGNPAAFPYGVVMWGAFLPLSSLAHALGANLHFAYAGTLLVADLGMLLALRHLHPGNDRTLLIWYWLSPIVVLATYWLGLNDLIPVLLLTLALLAAQRMRMLVAGVLCGAAVSAKFSMVLALPFFLIYLMQNKALRWTLPSYMKGLGVSFLTLLVPFALSVGGLHMLLRNPEMGKVYQFAVELGVNSRLYLLPMAYVLALYLTWQIRRLNFELFMAMLGLAFFLVVLMTPASPGWFIWILPLLIGYLIRSDRKAAGLTAVFTILYAIGNVIVMPWPESAIDMPWLQERTQHVRWLPHPMLPTLLTAVGAVLGWRIWRDTVKANDYFRLSRKPFVIGIAGDSGAGKDTLSDALADLFGRHSVSTISGDDYHLWDRQKPMWQVMTHLNPRANDLESYAHDLLALTDGRTITSRHYDHSTGKMSLPFEVRSNDFIIASGLHALYLPILRRCYDLSIYLDIDEGLRRFLKLERDVKQRGHTVERVLSALAKRAPDSDRFIRPQAQHADLVMSMQPIHPRLLEGDVKQMRYKLQARSRHGLSEGSLARVLTGVCGLHVDMTTGPDADQEIELVIEGETSAEDIALAAQMLFPEMLAFLDTQPQWKDGILGLMQLITLSHIQQALKKRFLW